MHRLVEADLHVPDPAPALQVHILAVQAPARAAQAHILHHLPAAAHLLATAASLSAEVRLHQAEARLL